MRKPPFLNLIAILLGLLLPVALAVAAEGGNFEAQIAALQQQMVDADQEIAKLKKARDELDDKAYPLRDRIPRLEQLIAVLQGNQNETLGEVGALQKRLLDLDRQIARVAAVYDLAKYWKRYDQATGANKLIAFRELFRLARGREPNNEEMAQFRLEAMMLHKEIVDKSIVPLGLALADIGRIVRTFVDGVGKISQISNKALTAIETFTKGKAIEAIVKPVLKQAIERILLQRHGYALSVAGIERVTRGMAADSYEKYKETIYGTADPTTVRRKLQSQRAELAEELTRLKAEVQESAEPLNLLSAALADDKQELAPLEAELHRLDEAIAAAATARERARLGKEEQEYLQQMAGITGMPVVSGLFLNIGGLDRWRRHIDLAADDVSAHYLRLPRGHPYRFSIQLSQSGQAACLYDCKYNEKAKQTACQRSTMNTVSGAGSVDRFEGVVPTVTGQGLQVDDKARMLIGTAPGEAQVTAEVIGMVGVKSVRHPAHAKAPDYWALRGQAIQAGCDWNRQPELGLIKSSGSYPFLVHQIKTMQLFDEQPPITPGGNAQRIPLTPGTTLDLFQSGGGGVGMHRQGWANVISELTVVGAQGERKRGPGRPPLTEIVGDTNAFDLDRRGNQINLLPIGPGRGNLRVALTDPRGKRHFEQRVDLTANVLEGLEWDAPQGDIPARRALNLPIGQTMALRFVVRGDADMGRYQVRWSTRRPEDAQGTTFSTVTGFRRDGDRWVSENRVSFDHSRIRGETTFRGQLQSVLDSRSLNLWAELVRVADGQVIASAGGPQITPALPPITGMKIALLTEDGAVSVQGLDFFFPGPPGGRLGRLGLILEYAGGRVIVPLWMAEVLRFGSFPTYFRLDLNRFSDKHGEMRMLMHSGDRDSTILASSEAGMGILLASLNRLLAGERQLQLAADSFEDRLPIGFNRLVVERLGGMNAPAPYRLSVLGSAHLEAYTARWTLADGQTESTGFQSGPGGYYSDTAQAHDGFERVELLTPTGRVVATYLGSRDGTPLPQPFIHVQGVPADQLVPGATLTVSASISGMRETEVEDYRCRWEVDPAFGRVDPEVSNVSATLVFGSCTTTLTLSGDPDIAGRSFPVKARLVRQIGGTP